MMSLLGALCVLLAVTTTGYAMTCDGEECAPGEVCGSTFSDSYQGTDTPDLATVGYSSCTLQKDCNVSLRLSLAEHREFRLATCCYDNGCTPPIAQWPAGNNVLNGRTCSSCFDPTSDLCGPKEQIAACFGSENKCIWIYSAGAEGNTIESSGCATEETCDYFTGLFAGSANGLSVSCIGEVTTTVPPTTTSTGDSLSCIVCEDSTSSSCTGHSVICPGGSICGSQYKVTDLDGEDTESVSRKCVPKNQCGSSGSYSFNNIKIRTATLCCDTNNCNPPLPQPQSGNSTVNGLKCPSCSSPGTTICYGNTIECTGNENRCFLRTSTLAGSYHSHSVRGCSTQSLCDGAFHSPIPGFTDTNVNHFCRETNPGDMRCQYTCRRVTEGLRQ
uniref:UPAR/Ly6 domain-containing protein n=1 Tax=Leptobrachium leishanense TaxID=445787 RepID=A0A8C5QQJ9_9ANUR